MKRILLLAGLTCLFVSQSYAQGIIVNEVSQGPAGAQEFIELLVVGSTTQATGTVDLRDWIIDDNNGGFRLADNSAPGIATGHFRFAPSDTLAAVPIGALLVIYNVADPNPAWTFRQFNSSSLDIPHIEDNGFTYYIPGTSTLLRACSGTPNGASASYAYTNSTIPPLPANWTGQIGLANNGDAIQVRRPDGTFFHGFGFSTPTQANNFTSFPTFPEVGLPSFNGFSGVATGMVTYFDCGSYYYSSNFLTGPSATSETPGAANNANNALLINNIRAGLFQYSQLGLNVPCSQILPVRLLYFTGALQDQEVTLQWATAWEQDNDYFIVQRSADQKDWTTIGTRQAQQQHTDKTEYRLMDEAPLPGLSFYRLVQVDLDGQQTYSPIVSINNTVNKTAVASVYPNPATGNYCTLHITRAWRSLELYDILGRTVKYITMEKTSQNTIAVDISRVPKGFYFLKLSFDKDTEILPLVRN